MNQLQGFRGGVQPINQTNLINGPQIIQSRGGFLPPQVVQTQGMRGVQFQPPGPYSQPIVFQPQTPPQRLNPGYQIPPGVGTVVMTANGPALVVPGVPGQPLPGSPQFQQQQQQPQRQPQFQQHPQQQNQILSDEQLARRLQEEENRLAGL